MIGRYNGLKKATIIVRDDGLLDVIRERDTNGESFRGCANLEEAFETIRAHCTVLVRKRRSKGKPMSDEKKPRGFAAMPKDLAREISSKGGKAVYAAGTGHKFTSETGRAAGKKSWLPRRRAEAQA